MIAPRKPTTAEPAGSPARVEEADQAGTTAAWACGLGAATTQDSTTHPGMAKGRCGATCLWTVAVPRLHGLGGRCGGPGGPVANTSRREILRHPLPGRHARGADKETSTKRASGVPAPLGQRSDADLAALCRRRAG
ncbi:hypothetical protein HPB52_004815 [Rhipicephalus sanguineus]|uniref:Uncharacterized protein n=1 Tax=Rhipicephalus sanguineus TaxID=34632 RepID=A0A9D4PC73_RHISA|nr:hypothetical protein HPB52_004815 [Rhipicephalus sanguineus]